MIRRIDTGRRLAGVQGRAVACYRAASPALARLLRDERLFGEERQRPKMIPRAFGERAVLKLMYTALIRAAERWRGIRITEFEQRQLKAIRGELDDQFTTQCPVISAAITAAPVGFTQPPPDLTL
jgi:hypothetical protein